MPRPRTHIQLEKCKIADPYQTLALYLLKDALDHLDDEENLRWVAKAGPTFHFWCRIADVDPKRIIQRACSLLGVPLPEHECTQQAIINSSDSMRQTGILSQLRQTGILSGAGGTREAEELLEHSTQVLSSTPQVQKTPQLRQTSILSTLTTAPTPESKNPIVGSLHTVNLQNENSRFNASKRHTIAKTPIFDSPLPYRVFTRDNSHCRYCGALAECCDHVVPVRLGGGTVYSNLVASCHSCNCRKQGRGGFYLRIRRDRCSYRGELCYRARTIGRRGLFGESLWNYVKQDRAAAAARGKAAGKPRKELSA